MPARDGSGRRRDGGGDGPGVAEGLDRYQAMRDFAATPEPAGERGGEPGAAPAADREDLPRFVIQQHDATRLHWDLRLEHEGVLLSFAVPQGIPWSPERDHLAVHTEDHPLEYLDFHGEIPEGSYGAGSMVIWDRGRYEPDAIREDRVRVVLHGERVRGRYALFPTRGRDWMIHRMDPPEDPTREFLPSGLRPMRAVEGPMPEDPAGHAFEVRWRGVRALLASSGGRLEVVDERGDDLTARFPELRRLSRALGSTEAVLDAVVVALDRQGRPRTEPGALDRRLAAGSDSTARRLARAEPVAAMLVDVPWLDGHGVADRPWSARRELLEGLGLAGEAWQTPSAHVGEGEALLAAARAQGLPGLLAKRVDSPYLPGETSPAWVAVRA